MHSVFRASSSAADTLAALGPLQDLPGTWIGSGFNLIARPDKQNNLPFFLELNATREIIEFSQIGAPIENRGSAQADISFLGVHYLQQVSDAVTKGALHLEPGLWLNVPQTQEPAAAASVVRLASIPHGHALLAQGESLTVPSGPRIDPVSSTPITHSTGQPVTNEEYLKPFTDTPLPPGIPAGAIANPNLALNTAINEQKITETVVLPVATTNQVGGLAGGVENIPFLTKNADAASMTATFWIEKVAHPEGGGHFLQLQYTQTVILNFLGIDWPHISVATLVKH